MRLLIIGVTGLLGQTLFKLANRQPNFEVFGTARRVDERLQNFLGADPGQLFAYDLEAGLADGLYCTPQVVINCAGVIKQQGQTVTPSSYVRVNALAPYLLADASQKIGARFIHLSTDCVFSGRVGHYRETDIPDPVDLYGRSKLLGEVTEAPSLTVRTSFVGFERLHGQTHSLLDWFMAQQGEIKGYTRAIWSGLGSVELARQLLILAERPDLTGLLHLYGETISKFDLLNLAAEVFGKTDVIIRPDDHYVCDRSLTGGRLMEAGLKVPGLRQMLTELRNFA
jgi:dTDP-4-dehydrorhamnose reductase